MCFGGTPKPKPAPVPPTERDATIEGTRSRQAAAGGTGTERNMLTGINGVSDTGGTKSVLGG